MKLKGIVRKNYSFDTHGKKRLCLCINMLHILFVCDNFLQEYSSLGLNWLVVLGVISFQMFLHVHCLFYYKAVYPVDTLALKHIADPNSLL